jgi:hypothetical protein
MKPTAAVAGFGCSSRSAEYDGDTAGAAREKTANAFRNPLAGEDARRLRGRDRPPLAARMGHSFPLHARRQGGDVAILLPAAVLQIAAVRPARDSLDGLPQGATAWIGQEAPLPWGQLSFMTA